MEKNIENKNRVYYLGKLLYERTDEEHPLSTNEIIALMEDEYGLHVYRTTVSTDIKQLVSLGMDIYTIESTQNKYFVNTRLFDEVELKLLVDAIESSKFITKKKSRILVSKIEKFTSSHKASALKRNLCSEGRIKPCNENVFYIADAINTAINQGKKITFQYYYYNIRKEKKLKHDGETYVFSPYTLVWNGDYYYVVGYSDKHKNIGSFRVDRIFAQPTILKDTAEPMPKDFDIAEYVNTMFRMYNSDRMEVELICDNSVMGSIIDRFGEDVKTYAYNMNAFKAVVNVAVNHVFFSWIFGFSGKVKINSPQNVKDKFCDMLSTTLRSIDEE